MNNRRHFIEVARADFAERDPRVRIGDYQEFLTPLPVAEVAEQGGRCMDCGVPFCQNGCPTANLIPNWNDLVHSGRWQEAIDQLHATNNFPEFTGRVCPAPCEASCVLEINEGNAVTIKQIELSIIERAWEEGWVRPQPPHVRTKKRVAVVGSGPAGLACAQNLNRLGHWVTVFERDEAAGGLVRFGVPDFKLEKWVVDRRLQQLEAEGVELLCGVDVGRDVDPGKLRVDFDAVVIATGSRVPRDLGIEGRELAGVHFAMDYLYDRHRALAVSTPATNGAITAQGKHVVVVGGGDTGADCIGNAHREGAASILQLQIHGEPPPSRPDATTPWPLWPNKLRITYALKEGGSREFAATSTRLKGSNGKVAEIEWHRNRGSRPFDEGLGPVETQRADLVLLALGFAYPEQELLETLELKKTRQGNVHAPLYATSGDGIFAAGDARRGQSLIVTAIAEGRQCARVVDRFLANRQG